MNRFDRVTALLLLLQTRSVVTAQFLSAHFGVTERTIYRDIRTLENAGVPIGAEAGVGFYLQQGYRLPPVSFTMDEASALLLGEKLLVSSLDASSLQDFKQALNKIKAVIDSTDKDALSGLDNDVEVLPTGSQFPRENETSSGTDQWLRECRIALIRRQIIEIEYGALSSNEHTTRQVEPIGLFYYGWHWHLIAWCRLRKAYRDFRLDRIVSFELLSEQFSRHSRLSLQQYLNEQADRENLLEVVLLFGPEAARFVGEQRYQFGFMDEERQVDGVKMRFLTHVPDYMARWLLQYTNDVRVIKGDEIKNALRQLSTQLAAHWSD